jgi:hypothetical protein
MRHGRRAWAGLALGAIALLLVLGGTAYAKQDEPNKTGARFYSPSEYRTIDSEVGSSGAGVGQFTCTSSPYIEGNAEFKIPVDIPDGARITKVTAYYYDTDPSEHLGFVVGFSEPGVSDVLDGFTEVTSVDGAPTGPPGSAQSLDLIPTAPVAVDNANRRYFVSATFSACGTTSGGPGEEFPTLLLDGVRVEYTLK